MPDRAGCRVRPPDHGAFGAWLAVHDAPRSTRIVGWRRSIRVYGYRRIGILLKREGHVTSTDRTHRLCDVRGVFRAS